MGGLISLERFLEVSRHLCCACISQRELSLPFQVFPECRNPDIAGITVAVYELGCLLGAIWAIIMGGTSFLRVTYIPQVLTAFFPQIASAARTRSCSG